jgi:hypothetical protein
MSLKKDKFKPQDLLFTSCSTPIAGFLVFGGTAFAKHTAMRVHSLFLFVYLWASPFAMADDSFSIFKNRLDADKYLLQQLNKAGVDLTIANDNKWGSETARVKEVTQLVLSQIRSTYPQRTIPRVDPQVILLESSAPIAFALEDDEAGRTPYLFTLSTEFSKISDQALVGLIAHELTHLLLQWTDESGVFHPTEYFYVTGGPTDSKDPLNVELTKKITTFVMQNGEDSILSYPNIEKMRYENREDHADKVAMKILKALGISSKDYHRLLLKYFPDESLQTCNIDIEPAYGPINDRHHSSCWRAWRNSKIHN